MHRHVDAVRLHQLLQIEPELIIRPLVGAGDDPDVLGDADRDGAEQEQDEDRQTRAPALLHRDSSSCGMWTSDRRVVRGED
jgi:hypothetical protein